jgi:hypothetical protein
MIHQEMSEAEKHQFLDDQIRKGGSVFCAWCHGINRPGEESNPCCRPFALAVQERADNMVRSFANQYTAVEVGMSSSITCPMCLEVNRAPAPEHPADWKRPGTSPFCCSYFEHALAAHLEVKRVNSLVHRADQIAEALDKAANN